LKELSIRIVKVFENLLVEVVGPASCNRACSRGSFFFGGSLESRKIAVFKHSQRDTLTLPRPQCSSSSSSSGCDRDCIVGWEAITWRSNGRGGSAL